MTINTKRYFFMSLILIFQCCAQQDNVYGIYDLVTKPSVIEISLDRSIDTTKVGGFTYSDFPVDQVYASTRVVGDKLYITYEIMHPCYSQLAIETSRENFFILPNDTLRISLPLGENSYTGKSSAINQYLRAKKKFLNLRDIRYAKGSLSSTAADLQTLKNSIDSISNLEIRFLEEQKARYQLPEWFVNFEKNDILYFAASVKINAPSYRNDLQNKGEPVPDDYFDFIQTVPVNNHEAVLSPYYVQYLGQLALHYVFTDSLKKMPVRERLKIVCPKKLNFFDKNLQQPSRDYVYANLISTEIAGDYLGDTSFVNKAIERISNDSLRSYLVKIKSKNQLTKLRNGDLAPNFHLINERDSLINLSMFGGKAVLLAFWASWCKPCIKEIPYENKLYEELKSKNFELLSICLDSSEESWRNSIAKYNLNTTNLFANENWSKSIRDNYGILGYPHYVLIDSKGKIADSNTLNPSDKGLKQQIVELLN